jgi:hypothetical protein
MRSGKKEYHNMRHHVWAVIDSYHPIQRYLRTLLKDRLFSQEKERPWKNIWRETRRGLAAETREQGTSASGVVSLNTCIYITSTAGTFASASVEMTPGWEVAHARRIDGRDIQSSSLFTSLTALPTAQTHSCFLNDSKQHEISM